jgi:hypothetical protein
MKKDGSDEVGRPAGEPKAARIPERCYDSFHVRLWSHPGAERLLRVEVRHLQTDLVEAATAVPLVWLLDVLRALLAEEPSATDALPPT